MGIVDSTLTCALTLALPARLSAFKSTQHSTTQYRSAAPGRRATGREVKNKIKKKKKNLR